jgi:hypothetical protein
MSMVSSTLANTVVLAPRPGCPRDRSTYFNRPSSQQNQDKVVIPNLSVRYRPAKTSHHSRGLLTSPDFRTSWSAPRRARTPKIRPDPSNRKPKVPEPSLAWTAGSHTQAHKAHRVAKDTWARQAARYDGSGHDATACTAGKVVQRKAAAKAADSVPALSNHSVSNAMVQFVKLSRNEAMHQVQSRTLSNSH